MQRASDRWVSIALSVLLHGALLAALVYGWLIFRRPPPPAPTLAIEATVVDARAVRGAMKPPPQPAPPAAPAPTEQPQEPLGPPPPTPEERARRGIQCVLNVTQVPGGEVTQVSIGECNGDQAVRESIEAAVYRASPLPPPPDPALFDRNLKINFKPD